MHAEATFQRAAGGVSPAVSQPPTCHDHGGPQARRSLSLFDWKLPLILLFITVSLSYALKAGDHASAFVRWRNQIAELFTGEDIYLRHAYPNPPIMGLLLWPLVALPPLLGAMAWYYLKAIMAILATVWTFRLVEKPDRPFPLWARWLVVLLALRPMLGDLTHGNVNLFILFLIVASLYAFRHRRDGLAGLVLGLAIACKVTPALFLPYFVWKRSWRLLAGSLVGLILFFGVVPSVVLGPQRNVELLHSWANQMVRPFATNGEVLYTDHKNQSLPAVVLRLCTASPSYITYVDEKLSPLRFNNLIDLDRQTAQWIIRGMVILFAGIVVWCCRTAGTQREGWRLPAEFAVVTLGMLLFSERTWKHHCVVLLLPFAVLVYCLVCSGPAPALRRSLIACLTVAAALMMTSSVGEMPEVYGVHAAAHVVLLAALVMVLRSRTIPT